ncbi:hypothetical protein MHBO_002756 [Bonamia ostreae]|uniref:Uncharacterized protein n=1 Tax=Bonamia ostreae TaxID=126728 RepID=A0ABV2ANU6_9EUKA
MPFFIANDPSSSNLGFVIVVVSLMISSAFFAISQTMFYAYFAEYSNQAVQIEITGMAAPNVLFALYSLLIKNQITNFQKRQICYFLFPIVLHFAALFIFFIHSSPKPQKVIILYSNYSLLLEILTNVKRDANVNKPLQKKSLRIFYKAVLNKKWKLILLNATLLFHVFGLSVYNDEH